MNIGILGCGTLGSALARGLQGHPDVDTISATTRSGRQLRGELSHVRMLSSNVELARTSDVLFVSVKPFQAEAVLREIASEARESLLLISTVASVRTDHLASWIQWRSPIVRAMPNMPCRLGAGMTTLCAGSDVSSSELALGESLFQVLGRVAVVEERLMDAATGLSGSGPAYAYLIIEALSEAGVKLGIPRETAKLLAAQTLFGSAQLVLQSDAHPAQLKDEVTTPAGCTIDGLLVLEDGKIRSTLVNAVVAAATRSAELSTAGSS
jgi:pyrroline-5-carboxylate reductase